MTYRRERRLTTGYFDCKKRIKRLRRFQNLVRHREKWAHQIDLAPPLKDLIPELYRDVPPEERSGLMPNLTQDQIRAVREPILIDQEINKLIPMVRAYLNVVGISTRFEFRHREQEFDAAQGRAVPREIVTQFDIVGDYFRLPHDGSGRTFEDLFGVVEQAIGIYEARQHVAKVELFNPLVWLAKILSAPLYILERAGFDQSPEAIQSGVFQVYAWFIRVLVAAVLVLVAVRLGISVPWGQIWTFVLR
jgi:hypothetical protein